MANILFVIAHENFRDEELFAPKEILEKAGHTTTIASSAPGTCYGKRGGTAEAVIGLNQINAADFDAIVWVGGSGSEVYFDDPAAHLLIQQALTAGKILAAICAAPCILARAGVLSGKRATCFPDDEYRRILGENGTIYTGAAIERDGTIVTADGPESAAAFGELLVALISREK